MDIALVVENYLALRKNLGRSIYSFLIIFKFTVNKCLIMPILLSNEFNFLSLTQKAHVGSA